MSSVKRAMLLLAGVLLGLTVISAAYYGPTVYRVYVGVDDYDTVAPKLPALSGSPRVLVFSKTNGYRDEPSINAANKMLAEVAEARGWSIFFTENGAVYSAELLAKFDVVVWNSVSGDVLTTEQRAQFKGWIENGGGFVGIHGAGGDPRYRWRWYVETLIGAQFIGHTKAPQFQEATMHIEQPDHPVMAGLGLEWTRTDEWYSFDQSVRKKGYQVLATLDDSSYETKLRFGRDLAMGDHPVIWTHCVGKGRSFYSALGHLPETYAEPLHIGLLTRAVEWLAGEGRGC